GGVARRCHSPGYVASSRLALRKNPSVLFVPLFLIHDTSSPAIKENPTGLDRREGQHRIQDA
ncbi:MAG: hypothetical protein WA135_08270, partial [Thiobacillus sp.]